MPTYEYLCGDCDYEFEEFESISAAPLESCPKCEGTVKRLISAGTGLIFKGSGFYITDYKNASAGPKETGKAKKKAESKSVSKGTSDKATSGSSKSD